MSRKRLAPVRFSNNSIPTPRIQTYQYEYYRPGCYYIPQVEHQVTPYVNTYTHHWLPCCNTATYVIDRYGRANYLSDFEYQLQVPTLPLRQPQAQDVIYHFYNDGEIELSSLPQIEEEDVDDVQEICIRRKRKRLDSIDRSEKSTSLSANQGENLQSTNSNYINANNSNDYNNNNTYVYRSNEGYLVEEPNDSVSDSV